MAEQKGSFKVKAGWNRCPEVCGAVALKGVDVVEFQIAAVGPISFRRALSRHEGNRETSIKAPGVAPGSHACVLASKHS